MKYDDTPLRLQGGVLSQKGENIAKLRRFQMENFAKKRHVSKKSLNIQLIWGELTVIFVCLYKKAIGTKFAYKENRKPLFMTLSNYLPKRER